MDLQLTFASGRMTGDGTDNIGPFLIAGRYDANTREADWVKNYPGSHNVFYRGFRDGEGIWGAWEIPPFAKGGFHIWPRRAATGEAKAESARVELPAPAIRTALMKLQPNEIQVGSESLGSTISRNFASNRGV